MSLAIGLPALHGDGRLALISMRISEAGARQGAARTMFAAAYVSIEYVHRCHLALPSLFLPFHDVKSDTNKIGSLTS